MKADLSLPQLTAAMSRFLHRYHVVIFVLTVVGGLALANFMLNQAINKEAQTRAYNDVIFLNGLFAVLLLLWRLVLIAMEKYRMWRQQIFIH